MSQPPDLLFYSTPGIPGIPGIPRPPHTPNPDKPIAGDFILCNGVPSITRATVHGAVQDCVTMYHEDVGPSYAPGAWVKVPVAAAAAANALPPNFKPALTTTPAVSVASTSESPEDIKRIRAEAVAKIDAGRAQAKPHAFAKDSPTSRILAEIHTRESWGAVVARHVNPNSPQTGAPNRWQAVVERTKARVEAERTGKQPTSGVWDRTIAKFQPAAA